MKAQGSGLQHPPRIHDVLIDQQHGRLKAPSVSFTIYPDIFLEP